MPYYIDNMHTEEQNSTGRQLPSSSDTYAVHFQVREFIPFPRKYKWTTWATKAPVRDSTSYFPLLEGQTGLKREKEESSELISQSFFMLDVSLLWKMSRETSNFLGCVPVFSNPLHAVINIKAKQLVLIKVFGICEFPVSVKLPTQAHVFIECLPSGRLFLLTNIHSYLNSQMHTHICTLKEWRIYLNVQYKTWKTTGE